MEATKDWSDDLTLRAGGSLDKRLHIERVHA
jgi:hypothetical protein